MTYETDGAVIDLQTTKRGGNMRHNAQPGDLIMFNLKPSGEDSYGLGIVLEYAFEDEYFYVSVTEGIPSFDSDFDPDMPYPHSIICVDGGDTYEIIERFDGE